MFDDSSILKASRTSPLSVAQLALDEIESRLEGNKVISDPNSPFCHLLEFGSSIFANSIQAMEETFPSLYPLRASSMEDLYKHMSDYDYVRMYSNPATSNIRFIVPKRYLIDNAISVNDNYKQVTIPKDTVFTIGRYKFGIHYPINIQINKHTKTFTCSYDTSNSNPLHALSKNIVDKYDIVNKGVEYLVVDFPIYQFAKDTVEYSITTGTGFCEKIIYNNHFYAARIYTLKNNEIIEMHQTQSHLVYDTTRPTALVRPYPDQQKLMITIPQVYLDSKLVGSKCIVEIYTTMGAMDIDTSSISSNDIQANFAIKSRNTTEYSTILKKLPFDTILQLSSSKITGGSNAITIDELRDRVVMDTLYDKVPVTEEDLKVYLADNSFKAKRYLDNITDRVWHAYRSIEDGKNGVVPSVTLKMRVYDTYGDTIPTFINQQDGSMTILPNTIYKYIDDTDDVSPLTLDELRALSSMDKLQLSQTLNNGSYMRSPFHMRIDTLSRTPTTTSYNLLTPKVNKLIFSAENYDIAAKMTVYEARIYHKNSGVGGYSIDLSVDKSDDLKNLPEEDIIVMTMITTMDNYVIYKYATKVSQNDTRVIYNVTVDTNYHLTDSDSFGVIGWNSTSVQLAQSDVNLITDVHVVFLVKKTSLIDGGNTAPIAVVKDIPSELLDTYAALSRQYIEVSFGHNLKDVIHNDMEISVTQNEYAKWEYDVPKVYSEDVYERDSDGLLKYTASEDGSLTLNKLYSSGDNYLNEAGEQIYLHRKGEIRYNDFGEPLVVTARESVYFIDTMFIDAKVYASERAVDIDFAKNIAVTLESYFDTIRNISSNLLERTYIYFRCMRSTGSANFNLGDGVVVKQNLEMSFRINCYVPAYVKKSTDIQATIKTKTAEAIEAAIKTDTISMLDIFEQVKSKMVDYIDHFTLLGINGNVDNQTFIIIDDDARPSIKKELVLNSDNTLSLEKVIDINFIALDDHSGETTVSI